MSTKQPVSAKKPKPPAGKPANAKKTKSKETDNPVEDTKKEDPVKSSLPEVVVQEEPKEQDVIEEVSRKPGSAIRRELTTKLLESPDEELSGQVMSRADFLHKYKEIEIEAVNDDIPDTLSMKEAKLILANDRAHLIEVEKQQREEIKTLRSAIDMMTCLGISENDENDNGEDLKNKKALILEKIEDFFFHTGIDYKVGSEEAVKEFLALFFKILYTNRKKMDDQIVAQRKMASEAKASYLQRRKKRADTAEKRGDAKLGPEEKKAWEEEAEELKSVKVELQAQLDKLGREKKLLTNSLKYFYRESSEFTFMPGLPQTITGDEKITSILQNMFLDLRVQHSLYDLTVDTDPPERCWMRVVSHASLSVEDDTPRKVKEIFEVSIGSAVSAESEVVGEENDKAKHSSEADESGEMRPFISKHFFIPIDTRPLYLWPEVAPAKQDIDEVEIEPEEVKKPSDNDDDEDEEANELGDEGAEGGAGGSIPGSPGVSVPGSPGASVAEISLTGVSVAEPTEQTNKSIEEGGSPADDAGIEGDAVGDVAAAETDASAGAAVGEATTDEVVAEQQGS